MADEFRVTAKEMTKQEEAREALETHFRLVLDLKGCDSSFAGSLSKSSLYLLSELDAVLKVVCPNCDGAGWNTIIETIGNTQSVHNETCSGCKGQGYIVEPLIKE
ncbi:hypothetical protein LCGC14_2057490 [marine sediment metagenome]|uniref:Uncharacterized protein n=1 Tax=marine sediment metagenome TaxID=412755 RepID=A0A0F9HJ60_9ZZZZ